MPVRKKCRPALDPAAHLRFRFCHRADGEGRAALFGRSEGAGAINGGRRSGRASLGSGDPRNGPGVRFYLRDQADRKGRGGDGGGSKGRPRRQVTWVRSRCSASKHHELDLPVFNRSIGQTIAGHLLDLIPVLTEISRRLLLRRKLGLHAARLARVAVGDLKKYRLYSFVEFRLGWRSIAHCCSFVTFGQPVGDEATRSRFVRRCCAALTMTRVAAGRRRWRAVTVCIADEFIYPRARSALPFNSILRDQSEIVLGVLEIILRRDPVPRLSFGAGQEQIAFIVSFCALLVSRLGTREPGRFISSVGGLSSSRRCAGPWLCRYGFKFRNVFHVHPYAAPA